MALAVRLAEAVDDNNDNNDEGDDDDDDANDANRQENRFRFIKIEKGWLEHNSKASSALLKKHHRFYITSVQCIKVLTEQHPMIVISLLLLQFTHVTTKIRALRLKLKRYCCLNTMNQARNTAEF